MLVLSFLLAGCGSALGDALAPYVPWLKAGSTIGLKPSTLDLHFINLTFGFTFSLGPLTALGLILGYLVYRKIKNEQTANSCLIITPPLGTVKTNGLEFRTIPCKVEETSSPGMKPCDLWKCWLPGRLGRCAA